MGDAFARESDTLWTLTNQFEPFAFNTIEDILKELDECQRTVDDDIAELREQIEELKATDQKLNATDQELKAAEVMNEMSISQVSTDLEDGLCELQIEMQNANEELKATDEELKTDINGIHQEVDDIIDMPLGSIIAWVLKPEKDADYTAELPDGWMRCDGSSIPSPSPWIGKFTPILNDERLFLRGGNDEDYLKMEEDQIQDLELALNDNQHTHTDSGHTHSYNYEHTSTQHHHYYVNKEDNEERDCYYSASYYSSTSQSGISNIQKTSSNIELTSSNYCKGDETQPKSATVIWIIRVF